MKLIRYRDQHMEDYIYFWTVDDNQVSPSFFDEEAAQIWLQENTDPWDNWRPCKDIG